MVDVRKFAGHALIWVAAAALAGCSSDKRTPAFLINGSSGPLSVYVSMKRLDAPSGHYSKCRLDMSREPLIVGGANQVPEQKIRAWMPVALDSFDAERCNATFTVAPGQAVLMFWSPRHGDDSKIPFIDRLDITPNEGRSIRLTDPEADASFTSSDGGRTRTFVVD